MMPKRIGEGGCFAISFFINDFNDLKVLGLLG